VSNDLVPFVDMQRMAVTIAKSGLFGIRTSDQALALMLVSQAEGRHPALAARDYDIIQGRPAKKAEAMLRDFLQAGGTVFWHELTDTSAKAKFSHPQGGTVTIEWDTARVRRAGLEGKDNYKKFPRAMLRSRVVSEGVRTVFPAATSGMYVPEEVRDIASDAAPGVTIDHTAEELDQFAAGATTEGATEPRDLRSEGRAAALRGVTEFRAFWGGLGDSERSGLERDLPEFEKVAKAVDDDPFGLTPVPEKPVRP
jgi:hypothetical protein